MTLYYFFAFLSAAFVNFICSILLLRELAAAGIKVSFFEIRWQVHKHMKTYRKLTSETPGKSAWLYYCYQASLASLVGFGILTLASLGD